MNTCFKVFASYKILQYLCDFIHVLIFVTVSKCQKSPKLTNIVIQSKNLSTPLDVSIFKPFKPVFRKYQGFWTLGIKGRGATKEDLAQWVSLALKNAMTLVNIKKGIFAIEIWAFDRSTMKD